METNFPMNFKSITRLTVAAMAVGLLTACSLFSDDSEPVAETNKPRTETRETFNPVKQTNSRSTSQADANADDVEKDAVATREPDGPNLPADEYRRRCQFWALNNMQPVVYNEFEKLDPDTMDDLDRILWRQKLNGQSNLGYYQGPAAGEPNELVIDNVKARYCRDYWAELLSRNNADRRNHWFEGACRTQLENRITEQYRGLADKVVYDEDNQLIYSTPNQYVRILQWLDISGAELLATKAPPYRILEEQSAHPYAYLEGWNATEEALKDYTLKHDERPDINWLGIVRATGLISSADLQACHQYYPQLFYGYWIPLDPADRGRYFCAMLMTLISDGARSMIFKPKKSALTRSHGLEEPVLDSCKFEGFIPNFGIYLPLSALTQSRHPTTATQTKQGGRVTTLRPRRCTCRRT